MVTISTRNDIENLRTSQGYIPYIPCFTAFRAQILEFYYFWKVLSGNFGFFAWIYLDKKLVYNANCPLIGKVFNLSINLLKRKLRNQ